MEPVGYLDKNDKFVGDDKRDGCLCLGRGKLKSPDE